MRGWLFALAASAALWGVRAAEPPPATTGEGFVPLATVQPIAPDRAPQAVSETVAADSLAADTVRLKGFFRRLWHYFKTSNIDQTTSKKVDFTIIGGPSYSDVTKFGIGLLASGLYRTDRSDTLAPPSDVALYGSVSTSGFFTIGITNTTILRRNRYRLTADLQFTSMPSGLWGIGYHSGRYAEGSQYVMKRYRLEAGFIYNLSRNFFVGARVDFSNTRGKKFTRPEYIAGQATHNTLTGLGAIVQYDSRDFLPNPYRGVLLSLEATGYSGALSSVRAFTRFRLTFDSYHSVWKGGVIATDLYLESNLGRSVPWNMLSELGGSRRMRGYYAGRYRDKGMIEAQVELRQRIYKRNGIALWVGAGNVFPRFGRFQWRHTLPNWGIGYRWEFKHRVNIRIDYGFGLKTSGLNFNVNEAF